MSPYPRLFRNHDQLRRFKRVQAEAGYWFSDKYAAMLNTAEHNEIPQNRHRLYMAASSHANRCFAQ